MKRVLALLLGAFVVVWAAALFDFGARAKVAPAAEPEPAATPSAQVSPARSNVATQKPAAPEPSVAAAAPAPVAPARAAAPEPAAKVSALSAMVRAAQGSVAVVGKTARAMFTGGQPEVVPKPARASAPAPESAGELGEGILSPEFEESERRYVSEPRDGAWAPAQEQRVKTLLQTQPWANDVTVVHCQQSLCRIVIQDDVEAKDTFSQLLQVPGLREVTDLRSDTPYSLRAGQLSVYFTVPRTDTEAVPPR